MSKNLKKDNYKEENKTKIVSLVNTFKEKKGKELIKEESKWIGMGGFMGMSDAIPGYSGGTTLAILGFFKRLILISKSVFIPEKGITRLKALMFMIPFCIGWIGGVFGFAKLTEYLAEHNMGLELIFFFGFFVALCIPIFIKSERPKLIDYKNRKIYKTYRWLWFLIGFLIVLGIGLYVFLGTSGVNMTKHHNLSNKYNLGGTGWIKLLGIGYIAGAIALIPGGSGAIIQLVSGMYQNIHWKIMAHADINFGSLVLFAVSTFLGMVSMIFIMSWGLKKHQRNLAALSFGMLLASISAIFLVPNNEVWKELEDWKHIIGIVFAILLSISFSIYLNIKVSKAIKKRNTRAKKMMSK